MLINFSVENYRSIRDRVTLNMQANSGIKDYEENLFSPEVNGVDSLMRVVPIYGLNGSGKTNLLKAVDCMRQVILTSAKSTEGDIIPVEPFLLDEESKLLPTTFEIQFVHKRQRYEYTFSANRKRVFYERLTAYCPQKQIWFERKYKPSSNEYDWKFSSHFKGERESTKNKTLENTLFFSKAVQDSNAQLLDINIFFRKKLHVIFNLFTDMDDTTAKLSLDSEGKKKVLNLLKSAELIDDFVVESREAKETDFPDFLPIPEDFRQKMMKEPIYEEAILHKIPGTEKYVSFQLSQESEGTRKLYHLSGHLINTLEEGGILFIDEFDKNLHCKLLSVLVEVFNNEESNQKGAQLIFTTHNPILFATNSLRRDQIWFANKDTFKSSVFYNLAEVSKALKGVKPVRKGQSILKGFLEGKFYTPPKIFNSQLSLFKDI